jgi:DNA-binding NtrC family response regulator
MDTPGIRILLVADNEGDVLAVRALLAAIATQRFDVQRADSAQAARELLAQGCYDVCLSDAPPGESARLKVGDWPGLEAIPIILLTENEDYFRAIRAAGHGAHANRRHGHRPGDVQTDGRGDERTVS